MILLLILVVLGQVQEVDSIEGNTLILDPNDTTSRDTFFPFITERGLLDCTIKCDTLFLESSVVIWNGMPVILVPAQPLDFF